MSFRNVLGARKTVVALASATSAENADRNGAALSTSAVEDGSLQVRAVITIASGSVVCTIRHEGSDDGSTWEKLVQPNNAANVTVTATATIRVDVPSSFRTCAYYRCVLTFSGAATAGTDLTAASYRYLQYGETEN